jgi:uncharacterized glyoxalase superfamily protein PhnB
MKKLLAFVALACISTPVAAVVPPVASLDEALAHAAYASGRCYVHMSDELKIDIKTKIQNSPVLLELYYEGTADSRKNYLDFTQCQRVLAKAKEYITKFT